MVLYNPPVTVDPDLATTGQYVPRREFWLGPTSAVASGQTLFSFFTSVRTETVSTITAYTGGTAAAATPTVCRYGLYTVASNGDLTLVASTANDTALWASTFTAYPKALSASYVKEINIRYAVGLICITGGALPVFEGSNGPVGAAIWSTIAADSPRTTAKSAVLGDLPSSVASAALVNVFSTVGFRLS